MSETFEVAEENTATANAYTDFGVNMASREDTRSLDAGGNSEPKNPDWIKDVRESADGSQRYVTFKDGSVSTYTEGVLTERTNAGGGKDRYHWNQGVMVQMDRADGKVLKWEADGYVLYDRNGKSLGNSGFTVLTADGQGYSVTNRAVAAKELGDPSRKSGSAQESSDDDEVIAIDTKEISKESSYELLKALQAKDEKGVRALLKEFYTQGVQNEELAASYLAYTGRSLNQDIQKCLQHNFAEPSAEAIENNKDRLTRVFDQVDTDRNGALSDEEMIAAMKNQNFKGEDSNFVAGLRDSFVSDSGIVTQPSMTKDDLEKYQVGKAASSILTNFDLVDSNKDGVIQANEVTTFAQQETDAREGRNDLLLLNLMTGDVNGLNKNNLEVLSANGKNTMASAANWNGGSTAETSLYGNNDNPLDAIKSENFGQGSVGDCHLMSTLSSLAASEEGRRQIQSMIRDNSDGTYTVTFPGLPNEPFTVKKPTESEQALYARTKVAGSGYFASVIEAAYGEYVNSSVARRTIIKPLGSNQPHEAAGTGATSLFSGDADTLNLMTGKNSESKSMSGLNNEQLEAIIAGAKSSGTPMIMSRSPFVSEILTGGPDANQAPPGKHFYAIVDYDPQTKMVTVLNPWNSAGAKYAGKFQMPLDQLRKEFTSIAHNTR
jgi:Ca2+-binding EF-hand superfamily protein